MTTFLSLIHANMAASATVTETSPRKKLKLSSRRAPPTQFEVSGRATHMYVHMSMGSTSLLR